MISEEQLVEDIRKRLYDCGYRSKSQIEPALNAIDVRSPNAVRDAIAFIKRQEANPAKEAAALVEFALSPPLMGMRGGSTIEERAIDRWKANGAKETSRLRIAYGPPSKAPELHRFLDLASEIFGYSRS